MKLYCVTDVTGILRECRPPIENVEGRDKTNDDYRHLEQGG